MLSKLLKKATGNGGIRFDDLMIIELFNARNHKAIEELSAKYGKLCGGIAFHILKNRQDADECVNDTYLKTWDSIPPQKPGNLLAYVYKIVRNLSLNRLKYNGRKTKHGDRRAVFRAKREHTGTGRCGRLRG